MNAASLLLALRTRWYALRREFESEAAPWIKGLVQEAAGTVLRSPAATEGEKAMATRAVAAFIPDFDDGRHALEERPDPVKKKIRLTHEGTKGEAVSFDDL